LLEIACKQIRERLVQFCSVKRYCFVVCHELEQVDVNNLLSMVSVVSDGVQLAMLVWTSSMVMVDITNNNMYVAM